MDRGSPAADFESTFRVNLPWQAWLGLAVSLPVALLSDPLVEEFLRTTGHWRYAKHVSPAWLFAKQLGEYWLLALIALTVGVLHPWRWTASAWLIGGAIVGGLMSNLLKWIVGRARPVTDLDPFDLSPFRGGLPGFFDQRNLSTPSGHVTMAFGIAMTLTMLVPRGWWIWFGAAVGVAMQRVAEQAHYPSDVLLGAFTGCLAARVALWIGMVLLGKR